MKLLAPVKYRDENGNIIIWEVGTSLVVTDEWLAELRKYILPDGIGVYLFRSEVSSE